jgi:hypothetical protein
MTDEASELLILSRADDAVFACPSLNGTLMPFQRAGVVYALTALGFARENDIWTKARTLDLPA